MKKGKIIRNFLANQRIKSYPQKEGLTRHLACEIIETEYPYEKRAKNKI